MIVPLWPRGTFHREAYLRRRTRTSAGQVTIEIGGDAMREEMKWERGEEEREDRQAAWAQTVGACLGSLDLVSPTRMTALNGVRLC